jgi:tetratricopeptide (TPR) repeat protein
MDDNAIPPRRLKADRLAADGHPAEAARLYQKLAEENPDDDSHLLCLAWALADSGEREKAIATFENLFSRELARGLVTGFAMDELVRIYREGKNWEPLISVCRRAAAVQPDDIGILQTLGEGCLRADLTAEAVNVFTKLVEVAPDAPELWGALGGALIAAGNVEKGESAFRQAARIDPSTAIVYLDRLARALLKAGYPEKGMNVWEECGNTQPDNPLYAVAIGECLVSMGQLDEAFAAFGRAAAIRPNGAGECWRRLGDMLTQGGKHPQAEESYGRAVAAEPQNTLYRLRLASCCASQGKNSAAAAILNRVKDLNP